MAKTIISRLSKPCTVIVKRKGHKILKIRFETASELLKNTRNYLGVEITRSLQKFTAK